VPFRNNLGAFQDFSEITPGRAGGFIW